MATITAGPNQLLADIQVLGLAATTTAFNSVSGQTNTSGQNSIQMTPNSVGSCSPVTNTYWHGLYLDVEPGVLNANQAEPDLQLWIHVDEIDYSAYFYVDISVSKNMLPHRDNTVGRQFISLGNSMYLAAYQGNLDRANLALAFTGPKISSVIDFYFASTAGFTTGAGGTFQSPPTIKLWGDVYDEAAWATVCAALKNAWPGAISMTSVRRKLLGLGAYSAVHAVNNFTTLASAFPQLPDGPKQGSVKVHRLLKFATPLNNVVGTQYYALSNTCAGAGGKSGQVGQFNDLGFKFNNTSNALRITEFGHRPGQGAGYMGITKGVNAFYPASTGYGEVDTVGNPRAWYGAVAPELATANMYYRMPIWGNWNPAFEDKEVIAAEDASFYVTAQNGQTLTAGTDFTAIGGVEVEA